jgi:uncharacterized protein
MKSLIISFSFLLLIHVHLSGQTLNPEYDKVLADSLGADDNGMKSYVLVILKTGPVVIEDKDLRAKLFKGHMDNINRLVKENKLVVAGPFDKNELTYRGLFILNVKTIEEAKTICQTDPAVKEGIFDVELLPWYGSAALGEYIKASEKVTKFKM